MNRQQLIDEAKEISDLNHQLESTALSALEAQGQLLARVASWSKGAGLSAMKSRKSFERIQGSIDAAVTGLALIGIVHADLEKRFEEVMDWPFDCPPDALADDVQVVELKKVA